MPRNKNSKRDYKGEIVLIEKGYFKGGWLLNYRQKMIGSLVLSISLVVLIYVLLDFYLSMNLRNNLDRLFFVLSWLSWIILFIGVMVIFSMKTNYFTIYKNGIDHPITGFSSLNLPFFHCDDISKIRVDDENQSLIITLKSGKEYAYDKFYNIAQLYPVVKANFKEYNHIKFIDP